MIEELVLDASAAVKWLRTEPGSAQAQNLLSRHILGELRIWMPEQCVAELLAVVRRTLGPDFVAETWLRLRRARIAVAPLNDELVQRAAGVCFRTGCSFYDALAPALAEMLSAGLVSADRRAHGDWPGVELLGGQAE